MTVIVGRRNFLAAFGGAVLHIIGNTARFVGAFVPVLINTRRREFIDRNHRLTHSVNAPTRRATSGPALVTTHDMAWGAS